MPLDRAERMRPLLQQLGTAGEARLPLPDASAGGGRRLTYNSPGALEAVLSLRQACADDQTSWRATAAPLAPSEGPTLGTSLATVRRGIQARKQSGRFGHAMYMIGHSLVGSNSTTCLPSPCKLHALKSRDASVLL